MFGIGAGELLIILIFGFIIFGPDKLPKIAKTVGHAIAKFNEVRQEAQGTLSVKDFLDPDSDEPFKDPIAAATKVKDLAVKNAKEVMEDGKTVAQETKVAVEAHKETLAERKARYDAERAAKEKSTEGSVAEQTASDSPAEQTNEDSVAEPVVSAESDNETSSGNDSVAEPVVSAESEKETSSDNNSATEGTTSDSPAEQTTNDSVSEKTNEDSVAEPVVSAESNNTSEEVSE